MKELNEILTNPNEDIGVKAYKFVNLLHMLSQEAVFAYIFAQKANFSILSDVILHIYERVDSLNVEKLTSLVLAALEVEGAPVTNLRAAMERLDGQIRSEMLLRL